MSYSEVMMILDTDYEWNVCPSAKPDQPTVEEALAAGQTSETVAASLDAFAMNYPNPPAGYPDQTGDGIRQYKLYWTFGGGSHYEVLNTAQALGLAPPDAPVEKMPPAYTAEDAIELAMAGWHYVGDSRFIELNTEAGMAEFTRRSEFAKAQPPSWSKVGRDLYWYLVVTNRLPSVTPPFGVRVSQSLKGCIGMTLQMWLDNQWAGREMKPLPWLFNGAPNPEAWKK